MRYFGTAPFLYPLQKCNWVVGTGLLDCPYPNRSSRADYVSLRYQIEKIWAHRAPKSLRTAEDVCPYNFLLPYRRGDSRIARQARLIDAPNGQMISAPTPIQLCILNYITPIFNFPFSIFNSFCALLLRRFLVTVGGAAAEDLLIIAADMKQLETLFSWYAAMDLRVSEHCAEKIALLPFFCVFYGNVFTMGKHYDTIIVQLCKNNASL